MAEKLIYDDFLKGLNPIEENFVTSIHEALIKKGYTVEVKPAAQGPVASYLTPKTKRTVFNYVFRKNGMQVRIYGDNVSKYEDFLNTLPESMIKAIDKSADCKRMKNPDDCNSRCSMGCDVKINGNNYKKCRFGAFMFPLTPENASSIKEFIENETSQR